MLIDAGDGKQNILVPYLLDRGIKTIDYAIVSHFDSDHCNGFLQVIDKLNVKNIIISGQPEITQEYTNIIDTANKRKVPIKIVSKGDTINIGGGSYIEVLYPANQLEYQDLNNDTLVCRLEYNNFSCIFTGDIEKSEGDLINLYPENELKSTILKISHHGSKSSSSEEFLEAVNPQIALIGVRKK